MTPTVLGYYRRTIGGRNAYIELSEGSGMSGEPIYGVTVRRADGSDVLDSEGNKLSKCCFGKVEALRYAGECGQVQVEDE